MSVPHIRLRRHEPVRIDGRVYRFERSIGGGHSVFIDEDTTHPLTLSAPAVAVRIGKGTFEVVGADWPSTNGASAPRAVPALSRTDSSGLEDRLLLVNRWRSRNLPCSKKAAAQVIAEVAREHPDRRMPSPSTLLAWVKLDRTHRGDPAMLAPRTADRGNRTPRLDPEVRAIIHDKIDEVYLRIDERPVSHVVRAVRAEIARRNAEGARQLRMPSERAIYREVMRVPEADLTFARKGPAAWRQKHVPLGEMEEAHHPNHQWEFDSHLWDQVVLDDESGLAIGRPWLTLAIDRYSRMPVGFHLGFEPPGAASAFLALRNAILPKEETLAALPDLKSDWPCFGRPSILVVDNAAEFRSRHFVAACGQLGIDVKYAPAGCAWLKGRVERFFGTLARDLVQTLPGATFRNVVAREGKPDPVKTASIPLSLVRELLIRWLVEVYAQECHRAIKTTPYARWTAGIRDAGIDPLPARRVIDQALTLKEARKVTRQGIQYMGITYLSPEIEDLIGVRGEVDILIDPTDLGAIQVVRPGTGEIVEVRATRRFRRIASGRTIGQVAAINRYLAEQGEILAGDAAERASKAFGRIQELARAEMAAPNRHRRRRAATLAAGQDADPATEENPDRKVAALQEGMPPVMRHSDLDAIADASGFVATRLGD